MRQQALFVALVSFSFAALTGCIPMCADVVTNGVEAKVVDKDGVNQPDAKVTYTVDGGDEEIADCFGLADDGKGCTSWAVAPGKGGHVVIKAESADGTLHAEATVDVEDGQCGPTTEDATLTLE